MKTLIILLIFLLNYVDVSCQSIPQAVKHTPPVTAHFDPEKATRTLLVEIPMTRRQKANDYTEGGHWLILWNFVNAAGIAWIFLFLGLSEWVKKRSLGIFPGSRGNFLYISLYFILSYLLSLPLNIYQHYVREKQYGFLNESFMHWLSIDLLKFMTEFIIVVPLFLLGYTFLSYPMKNRPAYGIAIPIVFIATAIFLKHDNPGNLLNFIAEYGILILSGFLLVSWVMNELILRYGKRLRLAKIADMAGIPLLIFLTTCYLFIMTPVINTIKRESEMGADMYGLNTARKPDLFISSVLKSADHEKADPGYWEEFFFYDHPCLKKRIGVAEKWKAENLIFIPFFDRKGFGC